MIGLLISVCALFPQGPEPTAKVLLLSGAVQDGRLALDRLHLGDGGVGESRVSSQKAEKGRMLTPGGILVRVQRQGVKLDFPSGAELLMTPKGRIHLRDGGASLPAMASGVELVFADDSRLRLYPSVSSAGQFRAELLVGQRSYTLWDRRQPVVEAGHRKKFRGQTILVLGNGQSLYKPAWVGPILVLERLLCPLANESMGPAHRAVIIGEALAQTLMALRMSIPRKTVEFPQAPEAVGTLAEIVPKLFPARAIEESVATPGMMQIPLYDDFRLRVTVAKSRTVFIGLYRRSSMVPVVEWSISGRTRLQLVRPGGGEVRGPRYYLKGVELEIAMSDLLETNQNFRDVERARGILEQLGARELGEPLRPEK